MNDNAKPHEDAQETAGFRHLGYEEVAHGLAHIKIVGEDQNEAKQNTAKHALNSKQTHPGDSTSVITAPVPVNQTAVTPPNFTRWLSDYAYHKKVSIRPVRCCKFVIGDKEYPTAFGEIGGTKDAAKEEAAKLAYNEICGNKSKECQSGISVTHVTQSAPVNCTRWLSDYARREKLRINPVRGCKFVIGDKDYPIAFGGTGGTQNEAKEEAAKLAYKEIQKETIDENGCGTSAPRKDMQKHVSTVYEKSEKLNSSPPVQESIKDGVIVSNQSAVSRFVSEFDSIERIGKGGFGKVYKAMQKSEQTFYAIKIVRYKEKARREVGALAELQHPNIVKYHSHWTEDTDYMDDSESDSCSTSQSSSDSSTKFLYIQMELCDMKTLKTWIKQRNQAGEDPTRQEESLPIKLQIIIAVEYIHRQKLIHRDLKPANIMFGHEGEVKVGDFGLVTNDNENDESLQERTEGTGTVAYMAPEQKMQPTYDRKVDIFALGLIYFELLWKVDSRMEKSKIFTQLKKLEFPDGFSKRFPGEQGLIGSMLCKKPEGRPEASEVRKELEELSNIFAIMRGCRAAALHYTVEAQG